MPGWNLAGLDEPDEERHIDQGRPMSFSARLRMTGQSRILLGVLIDVNDETITATFADHELARWNLDDIEISHSSDGFHISGAEEEAVLGVTDSVRFASAIGVDDGRTVSRTTFSLNSLRRRGHCVLRRTSPATADTTGR
jgi:hypothetical protein